MNSDQPQTIKQSLNKAYRLIKIKPAAVETFKANLVHLLNEIDEKESEENIKNYLETIFKDTYFELDFQEPENSSPVCFATANGLREGFTELPLLEQQTLSELNNNSKPETFLTNRITSGADLKEAINLIKYSIVEIIKRKQYILQTNTTALEKQIDELVYQLYELSPEEIAIVEGC